MRNNVNAIKRTLDLYDPDRQTVVVGTAALALQGIQVPGGVPDVDTLSPQYYVDELRAEMNDRRFNNTTGFDDYDSVAQRISLAPMPHESSSKGLLPYQSFCEVIDDRYDIDFFLAYARSVMVDDIRVVPVHHILEWKATIGREKDLNKIEKILSRRSIDDYLSDSQKWQVNNAVAASRRRQASSYGISQSDSYGQTTNYFRVGAQF